MSLIAVGELTAARRCMYYKNSAKKKKTYIDGVLIIQGSVYSLFVSGDGDGSQLTAQWR